MLDIILEKLRPRFAIIPEENRPQLFKQPGQSGHSFYPLPYEDCFCGSERIFIKCCGRETDKRPPPYGIHIIPDAISEQKVLRWRNLADNSYGERLKVIHQSSTVNSMRLVEDDRRISELIDSREYQRELNNDIKQLFTRLAQEKYHRHLDWFERPQILRYRQGGLYVKHADSENFDTDFGAWNKTIDRDLSLLVYLNDDFEGGELLFEKFNFHIRPEPGMAVIFPSDHRYIHEAQRVNSGVRYAIVSWASVHGIDKIRESPPASAIMLDPSIRKTNDLKFRDGPAPQK